MKTRALLLAVVLAVAGCSTPDTVETRRTDPVAAPRPAGAATVTSLPAPASDTSCGDPTASLRPAGPTPAPGAFPVGSTMAAIYQRGRLVVGVDQNTYGFGFRDPKSGQLDGFDIDMAREVARAIFGDPSMIQFRVLTSAERVGAVTGGEVDLVVQTMTINCDRRKEVEFSSVYYEAKQKVLVKQDSGYTGIGSLGGKHVCAAEGSTSLANIVNADVDPRPVGTQVAGWTDCLVMLQQNQVEAISTDDTILAGLHAQDPFTDIVGDPLSSEPYGMAMSQDEQALDFVRFVNSVLDDLRSNGGWGRIYDKWLSELLGSASPPPATYRD